MTLGGGTLGVYLPMDRRQALATGRPLADRCQGAALFADVSGFSNLASKLVETHGPKLGSEMLLERVNPVFDAVIAEVHQQGGSVVSFAGDGLLCWFDEVNGGAAAPRAVGAAMAMQAASRETRMKIAVAAGSGRRFLLGDPEVMLIEALAGQVVERMAAAFASARAGEVVLGEGTPRTPADAPAPWPEVTVDDESARRWLPRHVYQRLREGGAMVADLRAATPVFIEFGGIDYDADDAAGEKLDAYVRWAQAVFARYEGALLQLTMGDKGTCLYGALGVPLAHQDDARRAAAAALELGAPPPHLGWAKGPRVGIAQGKVWTGTYGSASHLCYSVMGSEVNVAARLMERARPGEAIVTRRVADAAASTHRFEARGEIALKGRDGPLAVSLLVGPRERDARDAAPPSSRRSILGREAEVLVLRRALDEAMGGASRCVLVEGSAGIGKSSLVGDLVARVEAGEERVLTGAGDAVESAAPYRAFRGLFAALLGLCGDESPEAVAQAVEARLAGQPPALLARIPLLSVVLPLRLPETEITAWMSDEVRAENTRDVLAQVFRIAAATTGDSSAPLLVVLDDAHWLDSGSYALVRRIVAEAQRLLVVLASRPVAEEPVAPAVLAERTKLLEDPRTVQVSLSPLTRQDSLALASEAFGARSLSPALSDLVHRRAAGHPYFSEQIASALRDAGLVEVVGGECRLVGDAAALELPDTIEGVITARLDRMAPADQETLKVASVIGPSFSMATLGDVLPSSRRAGVRERLDALAKRGLVRRDDESGAAWSFEHAILHGVTYGLMLFAQRRELHRAVGEWFERDRRENLASAYAILAHHFSRAEVRDKAVDYLEKAGEQALRSGAFQEAAGVLGRALSFADGVGASLERARIRFSLARAHYRLGNLPESRRSAEAAIAAFDRPLPARAPALVGGIARELGRQLLHRALPAAVPRAAAEESGRLRSAVGLYMNLVEVYYLAGEQGPSIYSALRQINVAERAGPSLELVEAYGVVCIIAGLVGQHRLARIYRRRAFEVASTLENPYARAIILHQVSLYHASTGEFDRVLDDETEAVRLFTRIGDKGRTRDALGLLGTTEYLASRYASAERTLGDLLATRAGDERFVQEIWGSAWLGAIALRRGQLDAALSHLLSSMGMLDKNTVGLMEISCTGLLALARFRRGELAEAALAAGRTADLIRKTRGRPSGHISLDGYVAVAEIAFARAKEASDTTATDEAVAWLHAFRRFFDVGTPAAFYFEGKRREHRKDLRGAAAAWSKSLAAAERLGMRWEAAKAHEALARAGGARAGAHAEAAKKTYEAMGVGG